MKKRFLILLTIALFLVGSLGVYAACNHDWSSWYYEKYNETSHRKYRDCYLCDEVQNTYEPHNWIHWSYGDKEYDATYHKTYYECDDCGAEKYVLEKHQYPATPRTYEEVNDTVCNAVYYCDVCDQQMKKAVPHKWNNYAANYSLLNDQSHSKVVEGYCDNCGRYKKTTTPEKHNLGFHKYYNFTYYGCDKCNYIYANKEICNTVFNKTVKKKKTKTFTVSILQTDGIKSIKVLSGKKNVKVKKKSANKFTVKGKKAGKAKARITLKSGVVYTFILKIKK
jgi:hypothetical protein